MGNLFYGTTFEPIPIPDALLAHIQLVAVTKLRRGECFPLTWQHPADQPGGRTTVWLQPSIPLRFVFDTSEAVPIDTDMLHRFAESASSSRGLVVDFATPFDEAATGANRMRLQPA